MNALHGRISPSCRIDLRPIGIVERQHRRLRVEIGRAQAAGMIRIALDLGRTSFVTLDQQPGGHAAERHRRRRRTAAGRESPLPADARRERSAPSGCAVHAAPTPASASDALINLRNERRPTGSSHSVAFCGNSRWRYSWNSGVSATASRLRQYVLPPVPRTRARISRQIRCPRHRSPCRSPAGLTPAATDGAALRLLAPVAPVARCYR